MNIELKKFGTTLVFRERGGEAFRAYFNDTLPDLKDTENATIDFSGVITFSPSWGDEFLTPLSQKYDKKLLLVNSRDNPSVQATLGILSEVKGLKFNVAS